YERTTMFRKTRSRGLYARASVSKQHRLGYGNVCYGVAEAEFLEQRTQQMRVSAAISHRFRVHVNRRIATDRGKFPAAADRFDIVANASQDIPPPAESELIIQMRIRNKILDTATQ